MTYIFLRKENPPYLMFYLKKDKSQSLSFYKVTSIQDVKWWKANPDQYLKNIIIKNYD